MSRSAVEGEQLVGGEALEVQGLARVDEIRSLPRRQDLVPAAVPLAPEGRAPGAVKLLHGSVAPHQPGAEGERTFIVVADLAELVAHVPHGNCRVARVPPGQRLRDGRGGLPVLGRRRVELVAGAVPKRAAVRVNRQRFGVFVPQPGRRRRGGRGQAHPDPAPVQEVQDLVQPAEVPGTFPGLQQGPAEDAHRDQVDAGFLHEPDVLRPGFGRPLLGVVVGAEKEPGTIRQAGQAVAAGIHGNPWLNGRYGQSKAFNSGDHQ